MSIWTIPVIPFTVLGISFVIVMILIQRKTLNPDDLAYVAVHLVTLILGLMIVIAIVRIFCGNVRAVELFTVNMNVSADISGTNAATLWSGIAEAEAAVCKYITRADGFIQNNEGPAGHANPSLVTAAQQKAQAAAGGPLTDCTASWTDISGVPQMLADADNRLTRLETTLNGFTGVVFQNTYNSTVVCNEGFTAQANIPQQQEVAALQARLTAVQALIHQQQQKLLGPIDQKTEDLKKGHLSDCDKARGKAAAMKPPPGTI